MTLNEHTDLSTLAVNLKKKVNGLLGVYFLIILLTILLRPHSAFSLSLL